MLKAQRLQHIESSKINVHARYSTLSDENSSTHQQDDQPWFTNTPQDWLASLPTDSLQFDHVVLDIAPLNHALVTPESENETELLNKESLPLRGEGSVRLSDKKELEIKLAIETPLKALASLTMTDDNRIEIIANDASHNALDTEFQWIPQQDNLASETPKTAQFQGRADFIVLDSQPWLRYFPWEGIHKIRFDSFAVSFTWETLLSQNATTSLKGQSDAQHKLLKTLQQDSTSFFSIKTKVVNGQIPELSQNLNLDAEIQGQYQANNTDIKVKRLEAQGLVALTQLTQDTDWISQLQGRNQKASKSGWFRTELALQAPSQVSVLYSPNDTHPNSGKTDDRTYRYHVNLDEKHPIRINIKLTDFALPTTSELRISEANIRLKPLLDEAKPIQAHSKINLLIKTKNQGVTDLPFKKLDINTDLFIEYQRPGKLTLQLPKGKIGSFHSIALPSVQLDHLHVGLKKPWALTGHSDLSSGSSAIHWDSEELSALLKASVVSLPESDIEILASTLDMQAQLTLPTSDQKASPNWHVKGKVNIPKTRIKSPTLTLTDLLISGTFDWQAETSIQTHLSIQPPDRSFLLTNQYHYDLNDLKSSLEFSLPSTALTALPLDQISPDLQDFTFSDGSIAIQGFLTWDDHSEKITGEGQLQLDNASGFYTDYRFKNIHTQLHYHWTDEQKVVLYSQQPIQAELIDVGIPLKETSFDFGLGSDADFSTLTLGVANFRSQLLGGIIHSEDISFDSELNSNPFIININHIDMAQAANLYPDSGITVEGILDGELPATLDAQGRLTIPKSQLKARAPGGIVKYQSSATDALAQSNQGTDIAFKALQNFHFKTLSADVSYEPTGWLNLDFKFQGNNPDLMDGTPINLNTNFELNVLDLLYSLRSQQTGNKLGERLQQRLSNE